MTFFEKVWQEVSRIPKGKVATYGQIAMILGTRDSRRIGHALHANKDRKVPCHRVVMKDGSMAPGFAFGGPLEQMKILLSEGVKFMDDKVSPDSAWLSPSHFNVFTKSDLKYLDKFLV